MIKQDYLVRMIQEIISSLINALLRKKKNRWNEWKEYDGYTRQILGIPTEELASMSMEELIDRYAGDDNKMGKIELAGLTMLKISDEMEANELVRKSKLRQDGLALLKYVQNESDSFSIDRMQLIDMLEAGES